jgi:hypothetical protein
MTRTSMSPLIEGDNEQMSSQHPRSDGPRRRRVFTPSEKLANLNAYEAACEQSDGGGYLRREGLYSSLISEWRKQRDAGVLTGKRQKMTVFVVRCPVKGCLLGRVFRRGDHRGFGTVRYVWLGVT